MRTLASFDASTFLSRTSKRELLTNASDSDEDGEDFFCEELRSLIGLRKHRKLDLPEKLQSMFVAITLLLLPLLLVTGNLSAGTAVVTRGKVTNVYVYPTPSLESWEQHMASLRPTDASKFSRASIDHFTDQITKVNSPSYFDALRQYSGINPPEFFGSGVASQRCVDAALKDAYNGVLQWDTIRSLSNCHVDGMDPSPQLNLIFSPDIKVAKISFPTAHGSDMCTESPAVSGWHGWGINTPNFTVLPTSSACQGSFEDFSVTMTHEIVEMLSDPAGLGVGTAPDYDDEVADICADRGDAIALFGGLPVARYFSKNDNSCQPRSNPTQGWTPQNVHTWLDASNIPLVRFTGQIHDLVIPVNVQDFKLDLTSLDLLIGTGNDDLRGGSNYDDNCNVILKLRSGQTITLNNVNQGGSWAGWSTHTVSIPLSDTPIKGGDIASITLHTNFGGGLSGDNWNVNRVQLVATLAGSSSTFVSQSVPGVMLQNQRYPISITFSNTGLKPWSTATAYSLGAQNPQDNSTWGMGRVQLPNDVAPGQTVTFNFTVTPPFKAGAYNFRWRMVQDGVEWFGDYTPNVVITVPENPGCDQVHGQISNDRYQIQALQDELKMLDIKFPGDRARIKEINTQLIPALNRDIQSLSARGYSLGCAM